MVMAMSQEASEAKYTMEQMANIIGQFNETLEAEKLEKVPVLLTVNCDHRGDRCDRGRT